MIVKRSTVTTNDLPEDYSFDAVDKPPVLKIVSRFPDWYYSSYDQSEVKVNLSSNPNPGAVRWLNLYKQKVTDKSVVYSQIIDEMDYGLNQNSPLDSRSFSVLAEIWSNAPSLSTSILNLIKHNNEVYDNKHGRKVSLFKEGGKCYFRDENHKEYTLLECIITYPTDYIGEWQKYADHDYLNRMLEHLHKGGLLPVGSASLLWDAWVNRESDDLIRQVVDDNYLAVQKHKDQIKANANVAAKTVSSETKFGSGAAMIFTAALDTELGEAAFAIGLGAAINGFAYTFPTVGGNQKGLRLAAELRKFGWYRGTSFVAEIVTGPGRAMLTELIAGLPEVEPGWVPTEPAQFGTPTEVPAPESRVKEKVAK